jgi:hypothetical protein
LLKKPRNRVLRKRKVNMTTELAKQVDETAIALGPNPREIIAYATDIANALHDVVETQNLFVQIGQKKHILAEGWETVISLDMAHPIIESTEPVLDAKGEIVAYKARAVVKKNGEIISSGEMVCGLDGEFSTQSKSGWPKHRAAMSSAQTWAVAKAGRQKYAWIVALAGYSGTPAEEMDESPTRSANPVRKTESPATDAQIKYLKSLDPKADTVGLNKVEVSKLIEKLKNEKSKKQQPDNYDEMAELMVEDAANDARREEQP